jgi:hypothetical protein
MDPKDRDKAYEEVRRCLAEADAAFARAGAHHDERERVRMIEEAEVWLSRAERRLARLVDRPPSHAHPQLLQREDRSFESRRPSARSLVWRRTPRAS